MLQVLVQPEAASDQPGEYQRFPERISKRVNFAVMNTRGVDRDTWPEYL